MTPSPLRNARAAALLACALAAGLPCAAGAAEEAKIDASAIVPAKPAASADTARKLPTNPALARTPEERAQILLNREIENKARRAARQAFFEEALVKEEIRHQQLREKRIAAKAAAAQARAERERLSREASAELGLTGEDAAGYERKYQDYLAKKQAAEAEQARMDELARRAGFERHVTQFEIQKRASELIEARKAEQKAAPSGSESDAAKRSAQMEAKAREAGLSSGWSAPPPADGSAADGR